MDPNRRRPTFLFIGTAKSGSTWIYDALQQHPGVFIPPAKDLQFFDYYYHLGMDWYLRHFENGGSALALGEMSHDYCLSAEAARRIREHLPDVRLICCLREPGSLAVSHLRWWRSHTLQLGSTFSEMVRHPHFIRLLAYRENLEAYFDLFPRDQIFVCFYEQLRADPRRFIRELYQFIGVDPEYEPAALAGRRNVTRPPRSRTLLIGAVIAAQCLRRLGAANLVGLIKRSPLYDRLVYSGATMREDPSIKAELESIAATVRRQSAPEFDPLSRLIGKPLPTEWLNAATE